MPRILLVTNVYPPSIGGPSLQTREIALALVKRGWDAGVLSFRTEEGGPPIDDGVQLYLVEAGNRAPGRALTRNIALGRSVVEVLRRARPDLVHVQACDGNLAWLTGIAAGGGRIPRLVKFSADLAWNRLNRDRYLGIPYESIHRSSLKARALTEVQRLTFRLYDMVWATSPFQADALVHIYGLPRNRVRLLPNLVGTTELRRPTVSTRVGQPPTALLVSRIVPWKGIDVAIRAVADARATGVRLRVVGGGSACYVEELKGLAKACGVAERVEFAGAVDPTRVADEFSRADFFVLPSRYEPFGIVFVQAMAAGLPVVATNVGGIPSIVEDGVTGLLVPAGSPTLVGRALARLVGDPLLRRAMSDRAREAAEAFSIERRIDDVIAMYEPLLARRGKDVGA